MLKIAHDRKARKTLSGIRWHASLGWLSFLRWARCERRLNSFLSNSVHYFDVCLPFSNNKSKIEARPCDILTPLSIF